ALPLMISAFSTVLMIFVDRLFLAHYSLEAHNAVVNASTMGWVFVYSSMAIASMAEVFVSQYNGAKKNSDVGRPVWQMLWYSLMTTAFFLPLGIWGSHVIYNGTAFEEMATQYFSWMVCFGPVFSLYSALAAFYIGRGKTVLVTCLSLFANLVNALLDYTMIFGVEGFLPQMGVLGAVIATCIGQLIQASILLFLFLRPSNRKLFGTGNWHLDIPLFKKCLIIGAPPAIFYSIETFGWAIFYEMMASLGGAHITVSGICNSMFILLSFFADGLSKGASVIAGNFLGARRPNLIKNTLLAGGRFHLIFFCVMAITLLGFPDAILSLFFSDSINSTFTPELSSSLKTGLLFLMFYMFFEGIRWLISGLLTAAGDTMFILIAGSVLIWACLVLPVYLFVVKMHGSVETAWLIAVIYSILGLAIYAWRFSQGAWEKIDLLT
ncbi:MAG: MATE family multidrug resistance protein, partial [Halioglobus sp.]